ncbi:MAG: hypothetical protein Q9216_006199 [Gyalolechia sp. 2 TL-2023]
MPSSNLPRHCEPTTSFLVALSSNLHTCVPTPLALVSTTLGILSIISWLFAQLPQILKNYKLKSASGLSIYFLAEWLLGDLTNLLGALLTRQASWQVVVAAYYVTVDILLVAQFFWYSHYKTWQGKKLSEVDLHCNERGSGPPGELLAGRSPSLRINSPRSKDVMDRKKFDTDANSSTRSKSASDRPYGNLNFSWASKEKATPGSSYRTIRRPQNSPSTGVSPNTLLVVSLVFALVTNASPLHPFSQDHHNASEQLNPLETAGRILSWTSTLLYLGSRLPQIFKNHRRRSTSGLSAALFIAAFFGNLFYSTSLLANPLAWNDSPPYGLHGWADAEGSDRFTWVTLALPFFLGAAGVLIMDAIIGFQFLLFGEQEAPPPVVVMRDERGRGHWRKVSGWMRGWVPSPGPQGTEDGGRPLLQRAQSTDRRRYGST